MFNYTNANYTQIEPYSLSWFCETIRLIQKFPLDLRVIIMPKTAYDHVCSFFAVECELNQLLLGKDKMDDIYPPGTPKRIIAESQMAKYGILCCKISSILVV